LPTEAVPGCAEEALPVVSLPTEVALLAADEAPELIGEAAGLLGSVAALLTAPVAEVPELVCPELAVAEGLTVVDAAEGFPEIAPGSADEVAAEPVPVADVEVAAVVPLVPAPTLVPVPTTPVVLPPPVPAFAVVPALAPAPAFVVAPAFAPAPV